MSSYAHVRLCARKEEDEKFEESVLVESFCGESIYFVAVMSYVCYKVLLKHPFVMSYTKTLQLSLVVLTTPQTSFEKHILFVIELRQLPDDEKPDPNRKFSCKKLTLYIDWKKIV